MVERLGREPRSRALFVFFGKRHAAVKVLFFDGTGLCLFYKRLDRGNFHVPEPRGDASTVQLSESEFDELVAGLDAVAGPRKVKPRVH